MQQCVTMRTSMCTARLPSCCARSSSWSLNMTAAAASAAACQAAVVNPLSVCNIAYNCDAWTQSTKYRSRCRRLVAARQKYGHKGKGLHTRSAAKIDKAVLKLYSSKCSLPTRSDCLLEVSRVGCSFQWVAVVGEQQYCLGDTRLLLHAAACRGTTSPAAAAAAAEQQNRLYANSTMIDAGRILPWPPFIAASCSCLWWGCRPTVEPNLKQRQQLNDSQRQQVILLLLLCC